MISIAVNLTTEFLVQNYFMKTVKCMLNIEIYETFMIQCFGNYALLACLTLPLIGPLAVSDICADKILISP